MKPLHLLTDASIRTMLTEFAKPAWHRNERDATFARESTAQLRAEQARRAKEQRTC